MTPAPAPTLAPLAPLASAPDAAVDAELSVSPLMRVEVEGVRRNPGGLLLPPRMMAIGRRSLSSESALSCATHQP